MGDPDPQPDQAWASCMSCGKWRKVSRPYGDMEEFHCRYEPPASCETACDECGESKDCKCGKQNGGSSDNDNDIVVDGGDKATAVQDYYVEDDLLVGSTSQDTSSGSPAAPEAKEIAPTGSGKKSKRRETVALTTKQDIRRQRKMRKRKLEELRRAALLEAGKDPDAPEPPKIEEFIAACKDDGEKVVTDLLAAKAEVNEVGPAPNCVTPLYVAAQAGHHAVVRALLAAGAKTSKRIVATQSTPLKVACENGHIRVVQVLLNRLKKKKLKSLDQRDTHGETALHSAVRWPAIVKMLLQADCAVDATTKYGTTALASATRAGCLRSAEILLTAKADPSHTDCDGTTPLWLAAFGQHIKIVELLLSSATGSATNPNLINAPAASGDTPLWAATLTDPLPQTSGANNTGQVSTAVY